MFASLKFYCTLVKYGKRATDVRVIEILLYLVLSMLNEPPMFASLKFYCTLVKYS